ncbi:MAG: methyl-accepting chemotaxis protein [Butyrivibrio sp.]|nr:methyl-accepting chemotaxis protein [Butyrivibrio sp.]
MDNKDGQKKIITFGIRTKLIVVIIPIVLVIIITFFGLSRKMITSISEQNLAANAKVCAGDIYAWTDRIFGELQVYKDTIEEGGFANDEEVLAFMETSFEKSDAYPVGLYMGDDRGVYLDASGWVPGDDWVLTERDWYLDGKENEEIAFGEPYYDSQTGDICVSAAVRMGNTDAVRVLAVDVYLNYLSEVVSNIEGSGGISSFLVTKESRTIIAHPNTDMIARTLSDSDLNELYAAIGKEIGNQKAGADDFFSVQGYFVCLNEIDGTDWVLVSYMSRSEALAGLHRLEIIMIVIAAAAAAVLIFATFNLMNRVVKPVGRITDVIQNVAQGDFSQTVEVKGKDEIAVMSAHMQEFLTQMRTTISDIIGIAQWLERQSVENGHVSGSLTGSSKSQSEAMEALGQIVKELSEAARGVSEQMEMLSEVIKEADSEGRRAGLVMRQTVDISVNGREAAERVSESMRHIEESISSLAEQMMKTDTAMEQIGSMVEMIVNVAEETNLLSLNASIEAARAGEAGKGFAVVADQIGKLAANSGDAADDISRLTSEIKEAMQRAIAKTKESVVEVKTSAELVGANRETFDMVYEKVGETDTAVERMVQLVGRTEEVAGNMHKIADYQVQEMERITQSAQELEGYTETVTQDSDIVARNAKELEREAKKLMERMRVFRI